MLSGIRKCDICGVEEFKRKPRRWDICASCDMKQRYDSGKTVPPIQVKRKHFANTCDFCGKEFEVSTSSLLSQKYCNNYCYTQSMLTETCSDCGKAIKKGIHGLCEKCNTARWHREEGRDRIRDRYKNDVQYRLSILLRSRVKTVLKTQIRRKNEKYKQLGDLEKLIGCPIEQLQKHIEEQFEEGMTWDNWEKHGWHIDHIIPLSSFDLTNEEELKKATHYTNLQPLWCDENWTKHAKILPEDNAGK